MNCASRKSKCVRTLFKSRLKRGLVIFIAIAKLLLPSSTPYVGNANRNASCLAKESLSNHARDTRRTTIENFLPEGIFKQNFSDLREQKLA